MMKKNSHLLTGSLLVAALTAVLGPAHALHAASASLYGVNKVQNFTQTSDTTVAPAGGDAFTFTAFAVPSAPGSITIATAEAPSGDQPLILQSSGSQLAASQSFASQAGMDNSFPSGDYTFMLISGVGFEGPSMLNLDGDSYPPTPQVANFSAAQAVDVSKDFTLNWNSFAGAAGSDFVQLTVTDSSGTVLFQTGLPGQSGALKGTDKSVTIPANKLRAGVNNAVLAFSHAVTTDTTSIAGATGLALYTKQTRFTIKATGSTGPDTTPPVLASTDPANGATGVAVNSPVQFTFSEAMAPTQSIVWSPTLTASKFSYAWSADAKTLTATYATNFPANSTVTWTLVPAGFKDTAGNALSPTGINGAFTTGSSQSNTGTPCGSSTNSTGGGSFSLYKMIAYVQNSAAAPTIDPDQGVTFGAFLNSPTNNPVTKATLQLPNGTTKTLTNLFGRSFMLYEQFATTQAADAAYPAGAYTVSLQRATGTGQFKVNYAPTEPPTPQLTNFPQTQSFDPTADLTLQWQPYTGAVNYDGIVLTTHDLVGHHFDAPDPCVPRDLPNTATSITIPKNTFGTGKVEGTLDFSKVSTIDTNSVPGFGLFSGVSKTTSFTMQTSGGSPTGQLQLVNLVRQQNGTVTFQVKATAGAIVTVQASSDLKTWTPVTGGIAAGGSLSVTDTQAGTQPYRFYRASAQSF